MGLADTLGVADPADLMQNLLTQRSPDAVQNPPTSDPNVLMDRLIRRTGMPRQSAQPSSPPSNVDFSAFGKPPGEVPSVDFSQFGQEPGAEQKPAEPKGAGDWSVGEGAGVAARSAGQAAVTSAGGVLKAGALGPEMAKAARDQLKPEQLDQSANENYPALAAPYGKEVKARQRQQDAAREREQAAIDAAGPIAQRPAYKAGQAVEDFAKDWVTPKEKEKYPITSGFGEAVGGAVPALAAGALGSLVGQPELGLVAAGGIMGAQSAGSTFDRAKKAGATDEKAAEAAGLSGVVNGAMGVLPVGVILGPAKEMAPGLVGRLWAALDHAAKSGVTFAGVGEAQHFVGEQLAKDYDPNAKYDFDYKRLIAEFLGGAALGGAHTMFQGRPEAPAAAQQPGAGAAGEQAQPGPQPQRPPGGLPPPGPEATSAGDAGAQARPQPEAEKPQPFKTNLNPKTRSKLEESANYYQEFADHEIASWSDAKLKDYVARKSAEASMGTDEDVLRRAGMSDDDINGMSEDERKETAQEARGYGVHAGAEPAPEGTREAPVDVKNEDDLRKAESVVDTEPTPAQAEAGNYQKAHVRWNGFDISIENPSGSVRKGKVDPKTGEPAWQATMAAAYGYLKRTEGADGDHVDVFMGPRPEGNPTVYVLDQKEPAGGFDEHKALIGFASPTDAMQAYLASHDEKGPARVGGVRALSVDEFKEWIRRGDTTQPISDTMRSQQESANGARAASDDAAERQDQAGIHGVAKHAGALPKSESDRLRKLRGAGDNGLPGVESELSGLLPGHGAEAVPEAHRRAQGQQQGLRPGQLPVGTAAGAGAQQANQQVSAPGGRVATDHRRGEPRGAQPDHGLQKTEAGVDHGTGADHAGGPAIPGEGRVGAAGAPYNKESAKVEPAPAHYQAVSDAVRSVGEDPGHFDIETIDHAAVLHAQGAPPDQAFITAVTRELIDQGYIPHSVVKQVLGDEAKNVLDGPDRLGGGPPPEKTGPAPVRQTAAGEGRAGARGGQAGAPAQAAEDAGPKTDSQLGSKTAGREPAAGAENGRSAGGNAAGGERPAEAGERGARVEHAAGNAAEPETSRGTAEAPVAKAPAERVDLKVNKPPKAEKKQSLLQFLASRGGIDPADPLIADVRTILGTPNKFIPGYGPLIRKGGERLDNHREAAVEAGYIHDIGHHTDRPSETTVKTLLDHLDSELREKKPSEAPQEQHQERAQDIAAARERIAKALKKIKYPVEQIPPEDLVRAAELVHDQEMDPLDAIERAAIEAEQDEGVVTAADSDYIDFEDLDHAPERRVAHAQSEAPAGQSEPRAESAPVEAPEAGGAARGPGESASGGPEPVAAEPSAERPAERKPGTERTVAGEQHTIPGAERISDAERVRRESAKPLRAESVQKSADEGLFGQDALQSDLVDLARRGNAAARVPQHSDISKLAEHETAVPQSEALLVQGLSRDSNLPSVDRKLRGVSAGHGTEAVVGPHAGKKREQQGIQSRQLPLGHESRANEEYPQERSGIERRRDEGRDRLVGASGVSEGPSSPADQAGNAARGSDQGGLPKGATETAAADLSGRDHVAQGLGQKTRNLSRRSLEAPEEQMAAGVGADAQEIREQRGTGSQPLAQTKQARETGPSDSKPDIALGMSAPAKPAWYYSAVGRAVEAAKQEKAAPNQWLGMLKNSPGVKPEEMEWLGLEDWLKSWSATTEESEPASPKGVSNVATRAAKILADLSHAHPGLVEGIRGVNIPRDAAAEYARTLERALVDAKDLRDLGNFLTVRDKPFSSLNVPAARAVVGAMRAALHDPQVFDTVVRLTPVDVMDNLIGKKLAPDRFLDDKSVLQNAFSVEGQSAIPARVEVALKSIIGNPAFDAAKYIGAALNAAKIAAEGPVAVIAEDSNHAARIPIRKNENKQITKQEIADYIRANSIELKEVTKGGPEIEARAREIAEKENGVGSWDRIGGGGREHYWRDARRELGTKFAQHTLPYGENYREMLLTLPERDKLTREEVAAPTGWGDTNGGNVGIVTHGNTGADYRNSHWDEPNVLAHVRFNDRSVDGKNALYLEEVQSDWHQTGRKQGYKGELSPEVKQQIEELSIRRTRAGLRPGEAASREYSALNAQIDRLRGRNAVPDAPFKTTWPDLILKRMIRYAAENGYDSIAWTPGELHPTNPKNLGERGEKAEQANEGMKEFYDKILPATVNKLVKKYGARVGTGTAKEIGGKASWRYEGPTLSPEEIRAVGKTSPRGTAAVDAQLRIIAERVKAGEPMAQAVEKFGSRYTAEALGGKLIDNDVAVHSLDITPALRDAALSQGFPLFEAKPAAKPYQPSKGLTDEAEGRRLAEVEKRRSILTSKATARESDIKAHLAGLIHRLTGDHTVRVEFRDQLPVAKEGWGDTASETSGGHYLPIEDVIRIALHDPTFSDRESSAFHESWHAVEDHFISDREMALLKREEPRLRQIAAESRRMSPEEAAKLADYEVRAMAFDDYASERARGGYGAGVHIGIRGLFERLMRLFRQIANYLRKLGFQTYEDIFAKTYEGKMKERPSRKLDDGLPSRAVEAILKERAKNGEEVAAGMARPAAARQPLRTLRIRDRIAAMFESRLANKIKEGAQDLSHPVKLLQEDLEARRDAPFSDAADFYTKKRLYPGRLGNEVNQFNKAHLDPLVDLMKANSISLAQAGDYVYAKHVAERNATLGTLYPADHQFNKAINDPSIVGASGRSQEWADNVMREASDSGNGPVLERIAARIQAMREDTVRRLEAGQLITPETAQRWREQYRHYVDLRGFEDAREEAPTDYREPARFNVRGKETKQAFGRQSKADNPIINMIDQAYRAIDRVERNRYLGAVWNAMRGMERDNPGILNDIARFDRGQQKKVIDNRTGLVKYVDDSSFAMSPNTVSLKIKGVPHHIVFENRDIAEAVKRMSPDGLGLFKGLQTLQNKLKALWTHYSPDFLFRHFIFRYPIEGALNSFEQKAGGDHSVAKYIKNGFPFMGTASRAIFASNKGRQLNTAEGREMQESIAILSKAGGFMMFRQSRDMDLLREHLQTQLMALQGKPIATAREKWRRAIEGMDVVTNALDNALRLAAGHAALKQGKTPQQAALIMRQATVDFQLKGKWSNAIGLVFPFGNIAIQTGVRMTSAVARSRIMQGVFAGTMLAGFLTAAFNYLIGGNDTDGIPFFEKIPEWDRRLNFIILNPWDRDEHGRPTPIKIPMPYNWAFPLTLGHAFGTMVFGKEGMKKPIHMTLRSGLEVLTPMGQEENMAALLAPELTRPMVYLATNRNYANTPIHADPTFQKGPNAEAGRRNTGEGWKQMASTVNRLTGGNAAQKGYLDFYPEDYKEILDYAVGAQRRLGANIYQTGKSIVQGQSPDPTHVPLERVVRGSNYDAADRAKFYEQRKEVYEAHDSSKLYVTRKEGSPDRFNKEHAPELRSYEAFKSADEQIKNLNKQIDRTKADPALSGAQKEERLKQLEQKELVAMGRARKVLDTGRFPATP